MLKTSLWVSAAICAVTANPACAQTPSLPAPAQPAKTRSFLVPAQPAKTGITAFAQQAEIQILAPASAVREQRTSAVIGRYTVEKGLQKLIAGTNLGVAANDGRTVTLQAMGPRRRAGLAAPAGPMPQQAAQETGLEEVIVTARKVEENAQSVPLAISALSGDQLDRRGVQRVTDLQYVAPGLVFSQTATSSFSPLVSMRGQTQTTIALTNDPSIGIYVDGVYLAGTAGLATDTLLDIERVEVLKGPQGTLFGRNTTGGAISIFTRTPVDRFEGQVTSGLGSDSRRVLNGVLNLPLAGPRAALRLVGETYSRNGFGFDTRQGRRIGDIEISTLRASLRWAPAEPVEVMARADWTSARDDGLLLHPLWIEPNPAITAAADAAVALFGPGANLSLPNRQAGITAYQALMARGPFSVAYDTPVFNTLETANGSLSVAYDFGPARLKSITALRRLKDQRLTEVDASDVIAFDNLVTLHLQQVTQEFHLTGQAAGERLKYATGLFFYHLDGSEEARTEQFGNLTNGGASVTAADVKARSWAVYGQATYAMTPSLNLTAGLRYTDESKMTSVLGGASNATAFACNLPAIFQPTPDCRAHFRLSDDNLSYVAALDWTPRAGVMAYVRTARGFKSGTINGRLNGAMPLGSAVVLPEDVTDYEVGVKSTWLDERLRLNAAAYHSNYENVQRSQVVCSVTCVTILQNAAKAEIDGFEVEAIAAPIPGWRLGFSAAYTRPRYKTFLSGGLDNTRENFLETPKWAYSASAGYARPVRLGELRAQVDWSWRSDLDMAPQDYPGGVRALGAITAANGPGTPDSIRIQDGYGLLNGSLTLRLERSGAEVKLFGANLLDRRYYSHVIGNVTAGVGVSAGTPGAPRTWGLDVTMRF